MTQQVQYLIVSARWRYIGHKRYITPEYMLHYLTAQESFQISVAGKGSWFCKNRVSCLYYSWLREHHVFWRTLNIADHVDQRDINAALQRLRHYFRAASIRIRVQVMMLDGKKSIVMFAILQEYRHDSAMHQVSEISLGYEALLMFRIEVLRMYRLCFYE